MDNWGDTPSQEEIDAFEKKLKNAGFSKNRLTVVDDFHFSFNGAKFRTDGRITHEEKTILLKGLDGDFATGLSTVVLLNTLTIEEPSIINDKKRKTSEEEVLSKPVEKNRDGMTDMEVSPPFRAPKKVCKAVQPPSTASVAVNNRFTKLPVEEMEPTKEVITPRKTPTRTQPKPIIVTDCADTTQLIESLQEQGINTFTSAVFKSNFKIFPEDKSTKRDIIDFLKEKGEEFFIVPDLAPTMKAVIQGLPEKLGNEKIKEALTHNGFDIIKVSLIKKEKEEKPWAYYLVLLEQKDARREIFELESLCAYRINVVTYRRPQKAKQCFRCNGFFHVARNCHRKPKCNICSLEHETRDCPRKTEPVKQTATCCNCGGKHAASYRGCPKFPDLEPRKPRSSYADAVKYNVNINKEVNKQSQPKQAPTQLQELMDLQKELEKELEIDSITQLIEIYRKTLKRLKELSNVGEKRLFFIKALSEDFSGGTILEKKNSEETLELGSASCSPAANE